MVAAAFDRMDLYSITTNQEAIRALVRYVGNLPPTSGVFPRLPRRQRGATLAASASLLDALGHASATTCGRLPGHQHQEHVVTSLAHVAEA
jgi:hypothetical protein